MTHSDSKDIDTLTKKEIFNREPKITKAAFTSTLKCSIWRNVVQNFASKRNS